MEADRFEVVLSFESSSRRSIAGSSVIWLSTLCRVGRLGGRGGGVGSAGLLVAVGWLVDGVG
jgi:hypothetical protein